MEKKQAGMCSVCGKKLDDKHDDKQCFKIFREQALEGLPETSFKNRFVKRVARMGFFKLLSLALLVFILLPQFLFFVSYSLFRDAIAAESWRVIEIVLIAVNLWTWCFAIFIGSLGERSRVAVTYRRWLEGEKKTTVDEIFLLRSDGRLIKHYTRRLKPDVDEDILAGMLVAVQDFVKDSFREESGALDELKFGELGIKIARGKYIILAAIISGTDHEHIFDKALRSIQEIELRYNSVLQDWDGDLYKVKELDRYVKDIIAG